MSVRDVPLSGGSVDNNYVFRKMTSTSWFRSIAGPSNRPCPVSTNGRTFLPN